MEQKLSHIGIAVKNLDVSAIIFGKLFGIEHFDTEVIEDQGVKVAFFHLDGASIELTEATTAASPIARFIEKRGEGVHHLSFEVPDIRAELKRLKEQGFRLIDEEPRTGAGGYWIAFVHPKSTNGVLVEISQKIRA